MAKIFYDHLILIEEVIMELSHDDLDPEKRQELVALIDQTLHHHILDIILTHLPQHHHEAFLTRFHKAPHDPQLLVFLKENIAIDIEGAIQERAKMVKQDILSEIKNARNTRRQQKKK